jgi:hypothetical protein
VLKGRARTQGVEHLVEIAQREAAFNQGLDTLVGGADGLGDLVDVLRLDDGLEIVLEQLGEVVCRLSAPWRHQP